MDKAKVIDKFNEAIGFEWAGVLQYNQYAQVLLGESRQIWQEYFLGQSDESLKHARIFGERVVALGGVPNCEPEAIKQTNNLTEMLENCLAVESKLVEIYTEALELCEDNPAYRNLLEDQIQAETMDVEELLMYLERVGKVGADSGASAKKSA